MIFHPGGEGLAQDRDQRLQGRKWQHIQPGCGGGLHVRRPDRPQDLPVEERPAPPAGFVLPSQVEEDFPGAMFERE